MFVLTYVLNAFLNSSSDCDKIWSRDGELDLREEDPGRFSNRDFDIIIIFCLEMVITKLLLLLLIR